MLSLVRMSIAVDGAVVYLHLALVVGGCEMNWHRNWMRNRGSMWCGDIFVLFHAMLGQKLAIGSAQPCVPLRNSYNILLDFRWIGETIATLSCYGNVKWRHEFTISHLSWLFVRKVQRNVARVAPLFIRVLSSSFYSQFARNFPFSISFECLAAWWLRIRHQMQIEVEALKKF